MHHRHGGAPGLDLDQTCGACAIRYGVASRVQHALFDLNQARRICRLLTGGEPSPGIVAMRERIDNLLPTAQEVQKRAALKDAEKADEFVRRLAAAEAEKRKLIATLGKPSGLSGDEKVRLASAVIQRAAGNGLAEVQICRFPISLCTDKGRAINQMEVGWENTLTGLAREIYQLWTDHLQPRGYRIRYQIVDFPGGIPGDISIVLSWGD
jgi:hypothetical protein